MQDQPRRPCIGVFDSGLGGLTVLRELRHRLPLAPLLYLADTAHAPYGEKTPEFLIERCLHLGAHLRGQGARLLVIACNTATAHAIDALRRRWPEMPIVGTEPGVKPAVAASHNGRIGVLATPATVASARYKSLLARHAGGAQVISQACPGLADLIEHGDLHAPALHALIEHVCAPLREAGVDTVLMGCTHYPLVQDQLQAALGSSVRLLNIESAVAQQAERLWNGLNLDADSAATLRLQSTRDAAALTRFVRTALGWTEVQAEVTSAT